MGTKVTIVLYAADSLQAKQGAAQAFARFDQLNLTLSDYRVDSELSRLSDSGGALKAVPVSQDLWVVLSKAQEVARKTGGLFDPTVGPLTRLWRWAFRRHSLPPLDRLQEATAAVGYQFLELDSATRSVRLLLPGMRLDLGGIAKGFAADEALAILQSHGIAAAVVDAGGDIALGAAPPGAPGWDVTLAPFGDVSFARCGVATSGASYRYMESDGVRYSHIVDPRTGLGVTHGRSVTVVAQSAMEADALASAASVAAPGELLRFQDAFDARVCEFQAQAGIDLPELSHCTDICGQGGIGIIVW